MYKQDRGFGQQRRSFAPVQVGQEIDVKIEAVGEKGDGIAKIKGFVIFVPNVKAGDEVKIKITKVLRKVGFGEVVGSGSSQYGHKDVNEEESEESSYKGNESEGNESEGNDDDSDYSDEGSEEFGEDEKA